MIKSHSVPVTLTISRRNNQSIDYCLTLTFNLIRIALNNESGVQTITRQ